MIGENARCLQLPRRHAYHSFAMNQELGRSLIVFGAVIVLIGVLLLFAGKIPFVGRLPGDVVVRKGADHSIVDVVVEVR